MRMTYLKSLIFSVIILTNAVVAQNDVVRQTNVSELERLAEQWQVEHDALLELAKERASELGLDYRNVFENGEITEIHGISPTGALIYYQTGNADAAKTVSADKLWPGGSSGLSLAGDSMVIGEWDGGQVRTSHQEFNGRVSQMDNTSSVSNHPTHVAGTMIAGGAVAAAKGMSYNANLRAYDWSSDDSEMATEAANGLLISNHSYGRVAGWRYNSSTGDNEWWGDTTISSSEDYIFGFYTSAARNWDIIARNAPYYLICKSAGNDRGDNATGRHYLPWYGVYSSTSRPADGGTSGYDCISSYSGAKNILTVGAVNAITSGYSGPSDVVMSSFSGWGPTDDGRIKPDIVANGVGVYSSLGTTDSAYASWNGTSMATPNASGALLLVQQHHRNTHGTYMKAATLKALTIHTAEEAGSNTGPDYAYGWGLLNVEKAANHISDTSGDKDILEASLNNGQTMTLHFSNPDSISIRATICWTDVAGTPVSASLDPTTLMLVNDLDIRLIRDSDSTVYFPYVLNPSSPSSAATTGDNFRDNVEQIYLAAPSPGNYTLAISHKSSLSGGTSQDFSLILDGGEVEPPTLFCTTVIDSFPFVNDFDTYTNCSSTSSAACPLPSSIKWENDTLDDIDWKIYSSSTTSNNTGPDGDYTANGSGKYLYTEASTNGTGYPGKVAVLKSQCINLDTMTNTELFFAYHMSGSSMGSLSVEVFSGFSWTQVWNRSGHQDTVWLTATVDLSQYDGDTIQIRFVGTTGTSWSSDMAIDGVEVRETNPCPDPTNLTVYNITDTSAVFSWSSSASLWKIGLGLADSVPTFNATISFNPVLIYGLQPGTSYDFYVRDTCGNGNESNWIGPIRFTTIGPYPNPTPCGISESIPDNACPSFDPIEMDVSTNIGTQMGVDVELKAVNLIIEHTFVGDLGIALASPTGDTIVLSDFNGGSGNNFGDPSDTSCTTYTTFTMDATTAIASGSAPFSGNYLPDDSLQLLNTGGSPNGIWELLVCDGAGQDTGSVEYVELVFGCIAPQVSISNTGNDTLCQGESATLSVASGLIYQWYRNGNAIGGATNNTYSVTQTGNYNVYVSDTAGCGDSTDAPYSIVVNPLPGVSLNTFNNPFCQGDSARVTTSTTGNRQWYENGQIMSGQTGATIYPKIAANYNVLITNSFGCSDSAVAGSVTTVLQLPTVNIASNGPNSFCDGDSVQLTTGTANGYQWYRDGSVIAGATQAQIMVTTPGNYNVVQTNSNNCSDSSALGTNVTVYDLPLVHILATDTILCEGESTFFATVGGVSFRWYRDGVAIPNTNSANITATQAGYYNVIVTDSNNCSDSGAIGQRIYVNPLPTVSLSSLPDQCNTSPSLSLDQFASPSGGTFKGNGVSGNVGAGFNFDPSAVSTGNTEITYVYTDSEECTDSSLQSISVINCVGIEDLSEALNVKVYPNPSRGIVNIEFEQKLSNIQLRVTDMNGKELMIKENLSTMDNGIVRLDLNQFAKGIYFVQLQYDQQVQVYQIVLE